MTLPILSSRFFTKHSPDVGFFSQWQSLFAWGPSILPVYEWQGILYVGCLQPPENFPTTAGQVVFVLCEHEALKNLWSGWQTSLAPKTKTPPVSKIPSFELPSLPELPELPELPAFPEMPETHQTPAFQAPVAPVASEAPKFPETPAEFQFSGLGDLPALPELPDLPELPSLPDLPELPSLPDMDSLFPDLKVAQTQKAGELSLEEQMAALSNSSEESGEDEKEAKPLEEELDQLLDLSLGTPGGLSQAPAAVKLEPLSPSAPFLQAREEEKTNPIDNEQTNTVTTPLAAEPAPEKRAKPTRSEPVGNFKDDVTRLSIRALNSNSNENIDQLMEQIFASMSKKFTKSMVLLKSGEKMKPWRWDSKFEHASSDARGVPLITPSPFRIVLRTQKPYHGYVVPNDVSREFFTEWNDSHVPAHFTVAPVLVYDHVIGMLVGFGEKASDTKEALELAEKLADDLAQKIKTSPEALKAA